MWRTVFPVRSTHRRPTYRWGRFQYLTARRDLEGHAHSHPGDRRHLRQGVRRADGRLYFRDTHVPEMLRRGRSRLDRRGRDGHDDRQPRSGRRRDAGGSWSDARGVRRAAIVVTHGTDTMVETARALAAAGLGRQDDRADRRDGAIRVRQLRRALQPRQRAVVRAGAAGRRLRRDERPAFRLGSRPEEPRHGVFEIHP